MGLHLIPTINVIHLAFSYFYICVVDCIKLDAKCDSKEVKEIVMQEMDALLTCRPNDDESRNLQTTQNSGNVVEETVKEINEKNIGKQISLYSVPQNQKQT